MLDPLNRLYESSAIRRYALGTMAVMTLLVTVSVVAIQARAQAAAIDGAIEEARAVVTLVRTARTWTSEYTLPPDPTRDDRAQAMRRADMMVREMANRAAGSETIRFHLIAPHPLDPANRPDAWERKALAQLANGQSEQTEVVREWPSRTLRLVSPLVGGEACLDCHKPEGKRDRRVLGAVTVKVSLAGRDESLRRSAIWLAVMWLATLAGTGSVVLWMVHRMSHQLERGEAKLREMATTDSLTGAMNRRAIMARLNHELTRAQRQGRAVGVIEMDLDNFKSVNDTFGHAAGDAVLVETVRRVFESVRTYDAVGRLGGEEFLVVAPDLDRVQVESMSERIRLAIASAEIDTGEGQAVSVASSLGYTLSTSTDDDRSLLKRVDTALYRAKDAGRNRSMGG